MNRIDAEEHRELIQFLRAVAEHGEQPLFEMQERDWPELETLRNLLAQAPASANLRKHGVGFKDAIPVFLDPRARIFPDPDHSEVEERELIVGNDSAARLLYISFIERHGKVRIISARCATTRETLAHEKYLK